MLAIRRKLGQGVKIGEDIYVVISDVSGQHVQICVKAPKDMKIGRDIETDPSVRDLVDKIKNDYLDF